MSTEVPVINKSRSMLIDGVFASEAIDSSGEILDVKGADISDLENGKGVLNYEHRGDDANGASPNDVIGKIIHVRKIYALKDCETDRQKEYWRELELPFIYGVARLYDGAGHPGAIAAAAMIRDHVANGEQILARYSIEGSTLDRDGNRLVHTMARRVALTLKPCNRTCNTGLMADPNAPSGFSKPDAEEARDLLADFAENKKSESQPDLMKLGVSVGRYQRMELPLEKALAAGSYMGAPGTLTGGAALQVEDQGLHRAVKNRARAALRDWNQKAEPDFRKYLDAKLPDVDPGFLDQFADLVDDYRMKKAQPRAEDPDLFRSLEKKAPEPQGDDDDAPDWVNEGQLTIRGKPVQTSDVRHPHFDAQTGILHTQRGQFPMYIPSRDPDPRGREGFHAAMADPKASAVHAKAMQSWRRAHDLLKQGRLPDAVVMHAAMFSMMSPNTAVPVQELMYGHLVDAMREKRVDARNPDFKWLKPAWLRRDNPTEYPRSSREYFLRNAHRLTVQQEDPRSEARRAAEGDRRNVGEIKAFQLAPNKFTNAEQYHRLHGKLVDLIGHHGHDARAMAEDLMAHKVEQKRWDKAREKALAEDQPDPGEFPGMRVRGLAPKTARYMLGMIGGGNIIVPDTHMIRHLFGLEKDVDTPTLDYLRNVFWRPANNDVLSSIDQYYQQNHDSMQYMRSHPDLQGVADEDLVFPAFWRHWSSIVPHEQFRGMNTGGHNEYTDHQPFWDAIDEYVRQEEQNHQPQPVQKHDQDAFHQAMDSVTQHQHWVDHLGEVPAHLLYWALLAPKLLSSHDSVGVDANGEVDKVAKVERLAVELAISVEKLRKAAEMKQDVDKPPSHVTFAGHKVKPGKAVSKDGKQAWHIIGQDDSDFFVVPHGNYEWKPHEVTKLTKLGHGVGYEVRRWPEYVGTDKVVNASVHGHSMNRTPEQVKLIHGLDVGKKKLSREKHELNAGQGDSVSEWRRGPTGVVFVKKDGKVEGFPESHREVAYVNAARDVFGLGHYFPMTALIQHPVTGESAAVVQKLKGAQHVDWMNGEHSAQMVALHNSGELDRLGLMDYVLGNTDRADPNYMMTPEGLKLIDHARAFHREPRNTRGGMWLSDFLGQLHRSGAPKTIHPLAGRWIRGVSPEALAADLRRSGVPSELTEAAMHRLAKAHEFYDLDPAGFSWTDLIEGGH